MIFQCLDYFLIEINHNLNTILLKFIFSDALEEFAESQKTGNLFSQKQVTS